jgi:F-type H+-transporting ATPase subunit b
LYLGFEGAEMANTTTEAAQGTVEAVTGSAGHAAQSAGMPQLDYATFPNQIFWLLVALVVIYLVLSRVALPRIGGILADRQGKITSDIAAAEDLKLKAEAAEKAYNQALVDARTEANKIVAEARAEIQKDLDKATARADAEIAARTAESTRRIDEIRASAAGNVVEVAKDAAEAIVAALGGKADAAAVADAVATRLKG